MSDDGELTWWVIDSGSFLEALRRVRDGEDPDMLYAELYANSADSDEVADP